MIILKVCSEGSGDPDFARSMLIIFFLPFYFYSHNNTVFKCLLPLLMGAQWGFSDVTWHVTSQHHECRR